MGMGQCFRGIPDEEQLGPHSLEIVNYPIPTKPLSEGIKPLEEETSQRSKFYTLHIMQHPDDGIGYQVWPAAFALVQYLAQNYDLQGCHVLELGSGPGLGGIACAHLGADVTLTDMQHVIPLSQLNVENNPLPVGSTGAMSVNELTWGGDLQDTFAGISFDLIVGSDLTYFERYSEALLITLLQLASNTKVLLADSHREGAHPWKEHFGKYFDVRLASTLPPECILHRPPPSPDRAYEYLAISMYELSLRSVSCKEQLLRLIQSYQAKEQQRISRMEAHLERMGLLDEKRGS